MYLPRATRARVKCKVHLKAAATKDNVTPRTRYHPIRATCIYGNGATEQGITTPTVSLHVESRGRSERNKKGVEGREVYFVSYACRCTKQHTNGKVTKLLRGHESLTATNHSRPLRISSRPSWIQACKEMSRDNASQCPFE